MAGRKLNSDERRARRAADLQLLVKDYGRKAQKGVEPNDRKHDKDVLRLAQRLAPEDLDALLRDGEDDEL